MVKPVYLYDLIRDDFLEIPSDQKPRKLGRGMDCDLVTEASYGKIDRYQAVIQYFPQGDVKLTQMSSHSVTDLSSDGNDWDRLYLGVTEKIIPGSYIRFDGQYMIRLLPYNDPLVRERIKLRNADVPEDTD